MPRKLPRIPSKPKRLRGIARERIGTPPPGKVFVPHTERKPKHRKPMPDEEDQVRAVTWPSEQ